MRKMLLVLALMGMPHFTATAGITGISPPKRAFSAVPGTPPEGITWVYGLAIPFQLAPREAGLLLNVRNIGSKSVDFEGGTDLAILRERADRIDPTDIQPLRRGGPTVDPVSGRTGVRSSYPVRCGFVPLGALLANGQPHPHAGTGFGFCSEVRYEKANAKTLGVLDRPREFVFQQYVYDGKRFQVVEEGVRRGEDWFKGWVINRHGLVNAIPDGEDLLFVLRAAPENELPRDCVTRWRREKGRWGIVDIVSVTPPDGTVEPSLIRDTDGALLLSARPWRDAWKGVTAPAGSEDARTGYETRLMIWRSTDGRSWERILEVDNARTNTPVTLCQAADGSPFVAMCPYVDPQTRSPKRKSIEYREVLQIRPLAADRRSLLAPMTVLDCNARLGAPPSGTMWVADIPNGLSIRLADQRWQHLLTFRVADWAENGRGGKVTPYSGTWTTEVQSDGPARPLWRFE